MLGRGAISGRGSTEAGMGGLLAKGVVPGFCSFICFPSFKHPPFILVPLFPLSLSAFSVSIILHDLSLCLA